MSNIIMEPQRTCYQITDGERVIILEFCDNHVHITPTEENSFIFKSVINKKTVKRWRKVIDLLSFAVDRLEDEVLDRE